MANENSTEALNAALKIGEAEHILDLQKNGHLYCNTIKYFRKTEKTDFNRHDSREGAFKTEVIESPEEYKFTWNGKKFPGTITFFRLNEFDKNKATFKLYCLFGFKKEHVTGKPFINHKNKDFGTKALYINDLKEFIRRVSERLKELDIKFQCKYVNYYNEIGINKDLSIFHKPSKFKHQHELRILIMENSITPFSLRIGSIEDISIILDAEQLHELRIVEESG